MPAPPKPSNLIAGQPVESTPKALLSFLLLLRWTQSTVTRLECRGNGLQSLLCAGSAPSQVPAGLLLRTGAELCVPHRLSGTRVLLVLGGDAGKPGLSPAAQAIV